MKRRVAYILQDACDKQKICPARGICPLAAIKIDSQGYPYVVTQRCVGCNKCIHYCPQKAIRMKDVEI